NGHRPGRAPAGRRAHSAAPRAQGRAAGRAGQPLRRPRVLRHARVDLLDLRAGRARARAARALQRLLRHEVHPRARPPATVGGPEMTVRLSLKAESFAESVIREMTRVNLALHGPERAINFAQGFPDFEPSKEIVEAAHTALAAGGAYHQYATTWGAPALREAIAEKKSREWGRPVDPE